MTHDPSEKTHDRAGAASTPISRNFFFTDGLGAQAEPVFLAFVVFFLTLISFLARLWAFRNTTGMLFGDGTEEAYRLYLVHHSSLTSILGPFQMWAGRFFLWFRHETVYVTRWISFFAGTLSPILLFLVLRRHRFYAAIGAAAALALSPTHIIFSTTGTAEGLNFFLLILFLLAFNRAEIPRTESGRKAAIGWAAVSVAAISAAMLTRFEDWILIAVILPAALFRFRFLGALWLTMMAAPAWWLEYSNRHFGGYMASSSLVSQLDLFAAFRDTQEILSDVRGWLGPAGLALALAGFCFLLLKKEGRLLSLFGAAIYGFFVYMLRHGRIWGDPKYALALVVWGHIFIGAGVGAGLDGLSSLLGRIFKTAPPDERRRFARAALLGCVAGPLALFALFASAANKQPLVCFFKQWRVQQKDADFLADLEALPVRAQREFELVYFLTSFDNNEYNKLYTRPGRSDQYQMRTQVNARSVRRELIELLKKTGRVDDVPGLVVTELGGFPIDDLRENDCVHGYPINRIHSRYGFRVYALSRERWGTCP